jgi:hypothetical protein
MDSLSRPNIVLMCRLSITRIAAAVALKARIQDYLTRVKIEREGAVTKDETRHKPYLHLRPIISIRLMLLNEINVSIDLRLQTTFITI